MAQINWVGGSGSWSTAGDWTSGDGVPGLYDTATIDTSGITVSIGSGVAAGVYDLSVNAGTLALTAGGTLMTVDQASFGGSASYVQTGGTWDVFGRGAGFNGTVSITGSSAVHLYAGNFTLNDGGVLAASFSGAGALCLLGGQSYIESGFSTTGLGSLVINARVSFGTSLKMTTTLRTLGSSVIGLFGNTLTLDGNSQLEGIIGNGTVADYGTMLLGSATDGVTFHNALYVDVFSQAVQENTINLGDGDAGSIVTIEDNKKTKSIGTYTVNGNWSINDGSSVGSLINDGVFQKTFGAGVCAIAPSFTNAATGTLAVDLGTVQLNGLVNSLAGSVTGAGTLAIAGGLTTLVKGLVLDESTFDLQHGTLQLASALTYHGEWDQTSAILDFGAKTGALTLSGNANFDGGVITGYGGTLVLQGATQLNGVQIGGPNTITIAAGASVDQTGNISLGSGSDPMVTIKAGARWAIEGDSAISGSYGEIFNNGIFIDPNGVGDANIASNFTNETTGTLTVNNSTLTLSGLQVNLGGILNGSGELDLRGTITLESGVAISVGTLAVDSAAFALGGNLSYANDLVVQGSGVLDLYGNTLTASGTALLEGTEVTGGGVLAASGTIVEHGTAIGDGATLLINGTAQQAASAEQTNAVNLDPVDGAGTLVVGAFASYAIDDNSSISGNGLGAIIVDGTLTLDGTANTTISSGVTLAGHTVLNSSTLSLNGTGEIGGAIAGGALVFGSGTYSIVAGTLAGSTGLALDCGTLAVGGATVDLTNGSGSSNSVSFGGLFLQTGGTLNAGGDTLTLAGTTTLQNGTLSGAGKFIASGATTLVTTTLTAGALLSLTGTATQLANNVLTIGTATGDTSALSIAAGGTLTMHGGDTVQGVGTLTVAGSLLNVGNGTDTLNTAIVDTGLISVSLGTLNVLSAIGGSGILAIGSGGVLAFSGAGSITASNTVSFSATAGSELWVNLGTLSAFGAQLADFVSGDKILLNGLNLNSLTQTLSANHEQLLVSDGNNSITLDFTSALSGTLTASAGTNGVLLTHP